MARGGRCFYGPRAVPQELPRALLAWGASVSPSCFIVSAIPELSQPTDSGFFRLFVIQHELSLFGLRSKRQMMGKTFLKLFHLSMANAEIYVKHQQNGNTDSDAAVQMKSATWVKSVVIVMNRPHTCHRHNKGLLPVTCVIVRVSSEDSVVNSQTLRVRFQNCARGTSSDGKLLRSGCLTPTGPLKKGSSCINWKRGGNRNSI